MFGDDRPDHGVAKMRDGKVYFKECVLILRALLKRAERKMGGSVRDRACDKFWRWYRAKEESEKEFMRNITKSI
jgi:hypothetical protein